jgi:hypothetical protein
MTTPPQSANSWELGITFMREIMILPLRLQQFEDLKWFEAFVADELGANGSR